MCQLGSGELVPLQGAVITNTLASGGFYGGAKYSTSEDGLMGPWVTVGPYVVTQVEAWTDHPAVTGFIGTYWKKWAEGPPISLEGLKSFENSVLSVQEDKMVAYTVAIFSCEEAPQPAPSPTPTFPFVFPETGGTGWRLVLAVLAILGAAGFFKLALKMWRRS